MTSEQTFGWMKTVLTDSVGCQQTFSAHDSPELPCMLALCKFWMHQTQSHPADHSLYCLGMMFSSLHAPLIDPPPSTHLLTLLTIASLCAFEKRLLLAFGVVWLLIMNEKQWESSRVTFQNRTPIAQVWAESCPQTTGVKTPSPQKVSKLVLEYKYSGTGVLGVQFKGLKFEALR